MGKINLDKKSIQDLQTSKRLNRLHFAIFGQIFFSKILSEIDKGTLIDHLNFFLRFILFV